MDSQVSVASEAASEIGPSGQPTNTKMPDKISFPERVPGTRRISAWNVCGWVASNKKGFGRYVEAEDADILVLTETKVNDAPMNPAIVKRYPFRYWAMAEKKGYAGTAILSKHEPLSVDKTLPGHPNPTIWKGRIITLEYPNFYLVGTYVVNAGEGLKTLKEKKEWNKHLEVHLRELDKKKPVIWTGDLNVAPTEKDLTNAKRNWDKAAGYTEAETSWYRNLLEPPVSGAEDAEKPNKFIDIWRHRNPKLRHFTYFSYRFGCRGKGVGWRLDHFVASERILEKVRMCEIRSEIYGASDHCPIVLEIDDTFEAKDDAKTTDAMEATGSSSSAA
ncbi:hypothetical protein BDM02DRAFT_3116929 [Thelephora ganbajun]|uniref:Uncharacterized protein n=1 Tax=Thelephora ganbajun TaxID=370292 RepID=A0ACB6ZD73_THEGA|nr:hypothetical protein BDM02DRAFT_3116929 [Thelephora ganbajun]